LPDDDSRCRQLLGTGTPAGQKRTWQMTTLVVHMPLDTTGSVVNLDAVQTERNPSRLRQAVQPETTCNFLPRYTVATFAP
jgi:hypothetical protein